MKNTGSTIQIEVDALRVGMFVHLDVGWMSHPFPLSSFRIASAEQIAIIRSLGLGKLRWSPEHSLLADATAQAAAVAPPAAAPCETPEAAERRRGREALSAQRASLAVCERQFAEAARDCRRLTDLVTTQPIAARDQAQALSRALVDKMAGDGELCIRLLTEAAGDKASAHAVNVALISLLMGRTLGFGDTDMLDLGVGALLHDMGKLDLPARVRHREDHFTPAEARFYEQHVAHGVAHALKMGLSPGASLVIAQHHETADGSGFPLRLGSERMTPASSIVALVDRYDNLCNPHLPAKALTPHEALSLLFSQGRNRYDTAILGAFIRMMGVYPPGSVVQLTDDRYATVVGVNSTRPLKPRVVVCDPRHPADEGLAIDLERHPTLGIRRSLRASQLPREAQATLESRPRVAYFFEPAAEEAMA
ncbi:HD-GYP domain-containing protein [Piscinibacter sp. XHJ-5]|uniref:HD-GYP domain-containing protein n=1 Tax=Piscinibacter sp. XHJ-5 TaxID=3037797 RepID=UPI002452AB4E|nr:HD-GYP domain-containing protein [Piscinibacter sp. XHJ-5]